MFLTAIHGGDGVTVSVLVRQRNSAGYNNYWNAAGGAWQTARPAKIDLSQDSDDPALWSIVLGQLANYTGLVEAFFFVGNTLLGTEVVQLDDGVVLAAAVSTPPAVVPSGTLSLLEVSENRTWYLKPTTTGASAGKVITVLPGTEEVLSMSFDCVLDKNDSIDSVVSVVDLAGQVTIATADRLVAGNRREVHIKPIGYTSGADAKIRVIVATAQGQKVVGQAVISPE